MDNNTSDIQTNPQTEIKDFLPRLIEQLEDLIQQDINLPFHIKEIKDNGFLINVKGLLAFLSFDYMPWRYRNKKYWSAVFKSLKGKQFYGKVYHFEKDPLFIIFNAQVPQFKQVDLAIGEKYKGIVIKKNKQSLLIDFGHHFRWKSGSILGMLRKPHFSIHQKISEINLGDEIESSFWGLNDKGQNVFCNNAYEMNWCGKNPNHLLGEIVKARIIENKTPTKLIVDKTFKGILANVKDSFPPKMHSEIKNLRNRLKKGDLISCEVIKIVDDEHYLICKWIPEMDTEIVLDNSILNKIDDDTISKLSSIIVD